jgi:hypothetical protein
MTYIDAHSRARVGVKMVCPEPLDEKPIVHRRDVQVKLEISVELLGADSLEYCIGLLKTKSVKRHGSRNGRTVLNLRLEVRGATTGRDLMTACHTCSIRESSTSADLSIIDFRANEDLINVKGGKAHVAFRFLCLPGHHRTMDEEFRCATTAIPKSITYTPTD